MSATVDAERDMTIAVAIAIAIGSDHPSLAGHFPGNPIVPGVVLLDEAIAAIGRSRGQPFASFRLASIKFLHPVVPPAKLTVRHRSGPSVGKLAGNVGGNPGGNVSIDFNIDDEARAVASGRIDAIDAIDAIDCVDGADSGDRR